MQASQYNGNPDANEPREELDVAYSIIRTNEYNDLLEQINFGTGYYEDRELEMQMRNIRKGLVSDLAFSPTLRRHAVQETKVKLADEGFSYYDESMEQPKYWKRLNDLNDEDEWSETKEKHGRTRALLGRGEEIWQDLSRPAYSLSVEQAAALDAKASMATFKPIFSHLAAIYHEQTKSKDARLMDDYFGRVKRHEVDADSEEASRSILRRNN